jgi:hypothetical protein
VQHILSTVRTTLARKEYSNHIIARIALNELAKIFNKTQFEGYLRYSILLVELEDQSEIILLFREKQKILSQINNFLKDYGYTKLIKDIRQKKLRKSEGNGDGYD